jgi:putative tricarboxylic transport membrane protein
VTRRELDGADRRATVGLRVFAVAVCTLGAVALYESTRIRAASGFSPFGPAVMVAAVGILLLVAGLLLLARLTVRPDRELVARAIDEERATHWQTTGLMTGLLVVYAFALGTAGYVLATGLMIPAGARVLGSSHPVRDTAIGVALGLIVYFVFTGFLGVRLPAGLLDPLLP